MVLARVGAGDRLNVNRPAPTRLVGHPSDDRVIEIDDVDPTVRNRPHVAWLAESPSLESHPVLAAANVLSADDRRTTCTASVRSILLRRTDATSRGPLYAALRPVNCPHSRAAFMPLMSGPSRHL